MTKQEILHEFNFKNIRTFQDALDFNKITSGHFEYITQYDTPSQKAYKKLEIWANAIRGGKKLTDQDNWYYPIFNRVSSDYSFSFFVSDCTGLNAYIGPGICVIDEKQAQYFAKTAMEDWKTFIYGDMTKQEIFDKAVTHLRTQNKKSLNDEGKCVYRSSSGLKCAVGIFIPDDLYKPEMEGKIISQLINEYRELSYLTQFLSLLTDLQCIHDVGRIHYWEDELESVATKHNLKYNKQ